jgi:hypothetical protein
MLRCIIALSTFVLAQIVGPALAQDATDRRVDQFLCKDVMRDSGANRDVAIAFLHGYLLGKANAQQFSLDRLRRESDAFIERCLDNPGEAAVDGMAKVKAAPR